MSIYHIAIMKNGEGDKLHIMSCNDVSFTTEKEGLECQGYLMDEYFKTTDRALYCKIRCKVFVSELKELEEKKISHLAELHRIYGETNLQVIRDTEKLYEELEETYINKIARAYARFLRANKGETYEYTDELAIQCYNYRENRMRLYNQLAKGSYMKDPYEC